jgi:hypothetical protein
MGFPTGRWAPGVAAAATVALVAAVVAWLHADVGEMPGETAPTAAFRTIESDPAETVEGAAAGEESPRAEPESESHEGRRQEPDLSRLPPGLARIADEGLPHEARDAAVRDLRRDPSPETIQGLLVILDSSQMDPTIRNNVVNYLHEHGDSGLQSRLVAHLGEMLRDTGHSALWRDYCVQHLRVCCEQSGDAEALKSVQWAAAKADQEQVRRVGLYSLGLLARNLKWTEGKGDVEASMRVLAQVDQLIDEGLRSVQSLEVRTNAMRTAYIADRRAFIPEIRRLLADENEHSMARNVAASVLGQFGDRESIEILELTTRSGDERLRNTAARSLEMIRGNAPF